MINKVKDNLHVINLKGGISLVILIVSMVVLLILATTIFVSASSAIDTAKLTTFAKDLNKVQDSIESYYISNNVIPSLNGSELMNKDEFLSISRFSDILVEEIIKNNDLNSQFYTIDLNKINITNTPYGLKKYGENDVFVISYPSMNVYYPYGFSAKNNTYFSITDKITSVTKLNQDELSNPVDGLPLLEKIDVTQASGWVNNMDVNIEVSIAENETLFMSVSGSTNRLIETSVGKNTLKFNSLSSIVSGVENIKVPDLTLDEANYIDLGTKPVSERYVDILKYKNNTIVDKARIDLSNFNKIPPSIKKATVSSNSSSNQVDLSVNTADGGIREIRYEYLTKYTNNGTIERYYDNITDFDSNYMISNGKKSIITSNSEAVIQVPKNVQSVKVALIDKANNINLYSQEIAPRLYVGYTLDSYTKESLQLTAKVFSANGVKTISFSKSLDGINFTDEQIYTLNTTINGTTYQQCFPYKNISQNFVYIKITAVNYDGSLTETRIINTGLEDYKPASTWYNPKIPYGFSKSTIIGEQEVSTGLVIVDDISKNEFVWVPVKDFSKFVRVEYNKGSKVSTCVEASWDGLSTATELDKIYKSVRDNGGFYIARYEAGVDSITTPTKNDHKTVSDGSIKPVSKAGRGTWNFIKWGETKEITNPGNGAVKVARSMYNTADIASNLIYGVQWDAALEFIKEVNSTYVTNSTGYGNYSNKLELTGSNSLYKFNNIYDMAGNEYEWTMEALNNNYINRGGSYGSTGKNYPSSYRRSTSIGTKNANLGFRCALYLK
ncbi:MAG: hypothetical protein K0R72_1163 [Clostridia bacterium]|jgi:Tfp pilus assembly protein PilE|nr:hypothetical protein [Clostridia bacterium]